MKKLLIVIFIIINYISLAQTDKKSFNATRTDDKIKIDGFFDEEDWQKAPILTNFIQRRPTPGDPSQRKTEVRMLYDDEAIYIAARLYEKRRKYSIS